jgi:RimJ/RimL family protein N-acetyltransferase
VSGPVILETPRLLLREFDEADAAAFFMLGSHPAITRYTGDPGLTSIEHALEILRSRTLADYQKHGFGRWACVLRTTNSVIGFAGLKYLDEREEVDIGYRLLPQYWRRGLATEAGRAVLNFGFDQLRLERIIGLVDPRNAASVRVLEKLGMTWDGLVEYRGELCTRYVSRADEQAHCSGQLFEKLFHVVRGNQPARFAELGAKPAQDRRRVRRLAFADHFQHALGAPLALVRFADAVAVTGLGHVLLPLLSANTPCAHGWAPFGLKEEE